MTLLQVKKLKINKNFQPLPDDDRDEFFRNGIFEFNITKLQTFINDHPNIFSPEEILVKTARTFSSRNLNESVIRVADIVKPIILAEIAPDRFNVIDGNHRLERAYRDGINVVYAYIE